MDRSTAQTLLRRYGFDNSDPLNSWLDEGQEMFQNRHNWPFLQTLASIDGAASVASLSFPSDFFKIYSIRDTTNMWKLSELSASRWDREIEDPTTQGTPRYYTITGTSTIQLWPVPDFAYNFRVIYQRALTLVSLLTSDATSLDGPADTHYPRVLAAAYTALMAENEEDRAQQALQQFETAIDHRWGRYSKVTLDEPDQVVDVMGYRM